jgi:hypothetical protein
VWLESITVEPGTPPFITEQPLSSLSDMKKNQWNGHNKERVIRDEFSELNCETPLQ